MKTIEVKVAENEADVAAGGWREMTTVHAHAPVRGAGGAVVDARYAGSVLFFTNNPALRIVIEEALRSHERSIGVFSGSLVSACE